MNTIEITYDHQSSEYIAYQNGFEISRDSDLQVLLIELSKIANELILSN